MDVETIRDIHRYNVWATERVLACCDQLTVEQFTHENDLPWGSIRNQFVHAFNVHQRWLSWADGSMSAGEAYSLQIDPADYSDIESVRTLWNTVNVQNEAFLARLTPETLDHVLSTDAPDQPFSISTRSVMLHLAHHAMQHRTETTMALTQLGQSPGDLDYAFYVMMQG